MDFSIQYNRERFLHFLHHDFLPDDFEPIEQHVNFATKPTYTQQATRLGVCRSLDMVVYEIRHSGKDDPRVGLSKEAFRMLSEEWQSRALVLFVPENNPNNYRFSLIEIKLEGEETSVKIHRRYSNPRRYSFALGTETKARTPYDYLVRKGRIRDFDDLQKRFSVEVLTKEFYAELSQWYAFALKVVRFPGEPVGEEAIVEHKSKNLIRLLTRILFVWFIKQKNLIPSEFFDKQYLSDHILVDFDPDQQIGLENEKSLESKYYKAILQNLFFATLNCPIATKVKADSRERGFRKNKRYGHDRDANYLMRYEKLFKDPQKFLSLANSKVPFLNGGLFDCLDNKSASPAIYVDGFSDNLVAQHKLEVPDYLFFGDREGKHADLSEFFNDKKKKSVDVHGLINILETYNFTIEENTPSDQEVSLDPELLGKVFENLLASYNPETKTTARKQTGSFYTPREIVQYMVDESLVAHLKRTLGDELEPEYRKLMRYTDEELALTNEQKEAVIRSLFNCKIIDPACGSGAFPMGVLQQMVHVIAQLDPENKKWKEIQKQEALNDTSQALDEDNELLRSEALADIERSFNNNLSRPDYARKLYLIENCIYGVDIQPIAVQISKLRFFISLVVEQQASGDANDNFGIRPLPNLEAKFVAANTLVGLNKLRMLGETKEVDDAKKKLKAIRHKIFSVRRPERKRELRNQDKEIRTHIADLLKKTGFVDSSSADQMAAWDMFDQNASAPFFDPEWMFGLNTNAPSAEITALNLQVEIINKQIEAINFSLKSNHAPEILKLQFISANMQASIIELELVRLKSSIEKLYGTIANRVDNVVSEPADVAYLINGLNETIKQLNKQIDGFAGSLKSVETGYFDIVIGNPPYGVSIKGTYRKKIEISIGKVPDYEIYYYFIQIAHKLLLNYGILSYIIPNTYLFNTFADKYRVSLLEKWGLLEILDCSKFPVFESATVLNTINTWQKTETKLIGYRNTSNVYSFKELIAKPKSFIPKEELLLMNQNWGLAFCLNADVIRIIRKIKFDKKPLKTYFDVSQGYIPYRKSDLIKKYGKTEGERIVEERLWHSKEQKDDSYIKEIFGRDITKYNYNATGDYVKYGKHLACYVDLKFFNSERLLVREITNPCIMSCLVSEIFVNDPQLISIIPIQQTFMDLIPLRTLWAILNSKFATFFHFNHAPKATKGAFPKILVKDIKEFPIPNISKDQEKVIVKLANEILNTKEIDHTVDISSLEAEIDRMVYELYGLTQEEIAIIEGR